MFLEMVVLIIGYRSKLWDGAQAFDGESEALGRVIGRGEASSII